MSDFSIMPPKSQAARKTTKSVKSQTRRRTPDSKTPGGAAGAGSSSSAPGSDESVASKPAASKKSNYKAAPSKKSEARKPSVSASRAVQKSASKPVSAARKPLQKDDTSSEGIADELGIKKGFLIYDKDGSFIVVRVIGEGGFGAVLEVFRQGRENEQHFAMKVEKRGRKNNKLKMEIAILKEIKVARDNGILPTHEFSPHFTEICGRGKTATFVFLVMELVGKSLSDLKAEYPKKVFTPGTGIFAAKQCLEAVQDLHLLKFIHRDIKPANYAIGNGEKIKTVYILDFGISRKTINSHNEMKTPRAFVGFKGTVRFASRRCHQNQELSYADDCESWYYLLLDLVVEGGLPWRRLDDKTKVYEMKEECIKSKSYFSPSMKYYKHFSMIIDYISGLKYENLLDYSFIYECLIDAAKCCGVPDLMTLKLDWEKSQKSVEEKKIENDKVDDKN